MEAWAGRKLKMSSYSKYYIVGRGKRGGMVYYTGRKRYHGSGMNFESDSGWAIVRSSLERLKHHFIEAITLAKHDGITKLRIMRDTVTSTTKTDKVRDLG